MGVLSFAAAIVGLAAIYAILTLALNVHFGLAGLINFGMVAYFAVGAYTYAIITQPPPGPLDQYVLGLSGPPWAGIVGAMAVSVAFAVVTGWPCLRLRGDYLALMTFAFAEVLQSVLINEGPIANGSRGFSSILPPFYNSIPANFYDIGFAVITLAVLALILVALLRLTRSPYGLTLRAIRDDELAAAALGKHVERFRLSAFLLGAAVAGLGGVLFAWYTTVAQPGEFGTDITFTAFIALLLGGVGSNIGAVAGAFVLFGLVEALQFIPLAPEISQRVSSFRLVPLGLAMVLVLRFRPRGLLGWLP